MRTLAIVATHRATYFEAMVKFARQAGGELIPLFGKPTAFNLLTLSEAEGFSLLDMLESMFGEAWSFSLVSANTI